MARSIAFVRSFWLTGLTVFSAHVSLAGPYTDPGIDPSQIAAWASDVEEFWPGPIDIAVPKSPAASFGFPVNALGPVDGDNLDVCSLGDGGTITLYFDTGIRDGPGDDFAVFENGFFVPGGLFGELAFVEVSSNGVDYARFVSTSLQLDPVSGGALIDPSDFENLAGDQPWNVGTGFDLSELVDDPLAIGGYLDLTDIQYVRVVDVVGDGSTFDGDGQPIFDPYPTAFPSGGFDIDAIGVIHTAPEPESLATLVAGMTGLACLGRRRIQGRRCAARD